MKTIPTIIGLIGIGVVAFLTLHKSSDTTPYETTTIGSNGTVRVMLPKNAWIDGFDDGRKSGFEDGVICCYAVMSSGQTFTNMFELIDKAQAWRKDTQELAKKFHQ